MNVRLLCEKTSCDRQMEEKINWSQSCLPPFTLFSYIRTNIRLRFGTAKSFYSIYILNWYRISWYYLVLKLQGFPNYFRVWNYCCFLRLSLNPREPSNLGYIYIYAKDFCYLFDTIF